VPSANSEATEGSGTATTPAPPNDSPVNVAFMLFWLAPLTRFHVPTARVLKSASAPWENTAVTSADAVEKEAHEKSAAITLPMLSSSVIWNPPPGFVVANPVSVTLRSAAVGAREYTSQGPVPSL